ncbi:MAG: DUF3313 domain-containing protein [Lysobacterales bacterium]|nr:MAG: DUF3313 domain-containing protein [Xanthomonadales bacterium]
MRAKVLFSLILGAVLGTAMADDSAVSWDGLVQVKPKQMDAVFLLPGADFRTYTKVMLDPTEVAFKKDWMKDLNRQRSPGARVSQEDADKILSAARQNFDDIFREAFEKAGYPVVTSPGPDVLRVRTGVMNLDVNAPDTQSAGMSRTYTANAGAATLVVEMRDSTSGALLGRVLDSRETRETASMQRATSVSNLADFRALFGNWARISTKGLEELKAHSPVPEDLKPKQKLD